MAAKERGMTESPDNQPIVNETAKKTHDGERVIPADELENVPKRTTTWQKIVIAVSVVILIIIAFTYREARDREDRAAMGILAKPVAAMIDTYASTHGLVRVFGLPRHSLLADPEGAKVSIDFPGGPIAQRQAAAFAGSVCTSLAREYVDKGYMPRHLEVIINSIRPDGQKHAYGKAVFNGDHDRLLWVPMAP